MNSKKIKTNSKKRVTKVLVFLIILIAIICGITKVTKKSIENEQTANTSKENTIMYTNTIHENIVEEETKQEQQTNRRKATETDKLKNGLPVLMYHFFYDKTTTSGKDNNWLEISKFEEQIKYLADNDFYFPTWEEVEQYIDGKIDLPSKSVVITVDDGDDSFFELAVPIIQKYNVNATSFVITSWYAKRLENKERNIYYESHSDAMHEGATNGKGVMLSWPYDKIVEDVKTSSNTLGGATIFCYPFGQYNDLDKKALKDAGYKLAFTTEGGRVQKGSDKYALPRVRVSKGTTIKEFKEMVQ